MTIQLRLYGDLRKVAPQKGFDKGAPSILKVDKEGIDSVRDVLNKFNIDESETSHIFVNRKYSGFSKKVSDGDRVALFPRNMGLLYKWYFSKEENDEQ